MTFLLPTVAVTFAAFCVWLTVRIVNRREPWAVWLAIIIGVLIYVEAMIVCFEGRLPPPLRP